MVQSTPANVVCFNVEDLEHRITRALESVDRKIMDSVEEKGEFDDLFDEANNKGRRDYVEMIIEELRK